MKKSVHVFIARVAMLYVLRSSSWHSSAPCSSTTRFFLPYANCWSSECNVYRSNQLLGDQCKSRPYVSIVCVQGIWRTSIQLIPRLMSQENNVPLIVFQVIELEIFYDWNCFGMYDVGVTFQSWIVTGTLCFKHWEGCIWPNGTYWCYLKNF